MERKPLNLPEATHAGFQEITIADGLVCGIRSTITRKEKEDAAIDLVARGMLFDEALGICYEAAHRDVSDFFVIVKHYTDIKVEPFDSADGWTDLYDKLMGCGAAQSILDIVRNDVATLNNIRRRMETTHKAMFERSHSLAYQIQQALQGILTNPGQAKIVSEARDVNEFLIDALGLMGRQTVGAPDGPRAVAGHPLLSFAKREDTSIPAGAGAGG